MDEQAALLLGDRLERFGDATAAIDDRGSTVRYHDLAARADALRTAIGEQRRLVLLEGGSTVEWLVAYVACLRGRHPVLITPAGAHETQSRFEEVFSPGIRITRASGWRPQAIGDGGVAALHPALAAMLSTSGSTGSAKCVRLSHANLTANAAAIAEYLGLDGTERGTVNLPTHYSYGLSIVNSHLLVGGTLLLTDRSVIDREFWPFLARHGATSFSGVPHVYDLLSRGDLAGVAPPTLRYFTQAGGRLPPALTTRFATLAAERGWRFFVMYGQTEATARIAYLPPEHALRAPESIGVPIPGGRLDLLDADGRPVAAGAEGELVYTGPNVMMGYATGAGELALAPGPPRLETGDLARLGEDGLFRITGRLSRFVKIFGNRIGLDDVERLLADAGHPVVATGIDDHLLVVTRDEAAAPRIAETIAARLKLPTAYVTVRAVAEYPLLASGKIDYAGLKASIRPLVGAVPAAATDPGVAISVEDAFASVFGEPARNGFASFNSLGGDSLNYILVVMALERILPALPDDWETQSIDMLTDLAAGVPSGHDACAKPSGKPPGTSTSSLVRQLGALEVARGLCMIMVVMMHVHEQHYSFFVPDDAITRMWDYATSLAHSLRMPTFFLVSGFLVSRAIWRPWQEVAGGRAYFLLYLYLLWSAITALNQLLVLHLDGGIVGYVTGDHLRLGPLTLGQLYARFIRGLMVPTTPLWFLYALLAYFVVARAARGLPLWLSLGAAGLLSALSDTPAFASAMPTSFLMKSLLFYLAGCYLPQIVAAIVDRASWPLAMLSGALFAASIVPVLLFGKTTVAIWLPANCAGVMLCLMVAALVVPTKLGEALTFIGRRTLPIFLIHPILLYDWTMTVSLALPGLAPVLARHAVLRAVYPVAVNIALFASALIIYDLALRLRVQALFEMPRTLFAWRPASVAARPQRA